MSINKEGKSYDEMYKEKIWNENFLYAADKHFIDNLEKYLNDELDEKPIIDCENLFWKESKFDELLIFKLMYLTDFYVFPSRIYSFFKYYFLLNRMIYF